MLFALDWLALFVDEFGIKIYPFIPLDRVKCDFCTLEFFVVVEFLENSKILFSPGAKYIRIIIP